MIDMTRESSMYFKALPLHEALVINISKRIMSTLTASSFLINGVR